MESYCNEYGTVYVISSDFGDHMNAINVTNGFVKWIFLDPRDEVERPYKAKHEERTQINAELDEFYRKQ